MASLTPARVVLFAFAAALSAPLEAASFASGPPDGYAGNPPDFLTCTDCHGFAQGDGSLALLPGRLAGAHRPPVGLGSRLRLSRERAMLCCTRVR